MDFHKVETTSNFAFAPLESADLRVTDHGSDVYRIQVAGGRWPRGTDSFAQLTPEEFSALPSRSKLTCGEQGEVKLTYGDSVLLASQPGRGLGVCGTKWVLAFPYDPNDRFYGMGEKNLGFELSGVRTKFWNTDVFADFFIDQIEGGKTDPFYSSFPVLIIKTQGHWVGIVIDNPHAVFINSGADEGIFQPGAGPFVRELFFGARDGAPDVWFIAAATPDGLVRKIQTLQGRTPLPPLWALGHQQCRWGYRSYGDLKHLADQFDAWGIPNDGLWLDIDYMDGFRVFTVDRSHFTDLEEQLEQLAGRGYRVVPILDPGLRRDPDFPVYADALQQDILCQTPEGDPYIGFVWPGYTVFPDFSLVDGRSFWASQVKSFLARGFAGFWIDMNDPSTGSVPHDDMRFGRGQLPHSAWHNQYALGMAQATREGMVAARSDERPFVISRSAFLSQSRHSAVWTGDNMSNEYHMKSSIALSLNLSVSGMPFNGPDVPGFALSATNELMRAWYKLGFLFPFLRNHKIAGQADQEPWSRDGLTRSVVTDYIRLRYKLLPYLYNLFVTQHEAGDPILRPIWYHDPSSTFDRTDDMFFVGPAILQAPFVTLRARTRSVPLPQHASGGRWFDVCHRRFVRAGETVVARNRAKTTPFFLACPSLIPMQKGVRTNHDNDLRSIDLLVTINEGDSASGRYQFDDGHTLDHLHGHRSVYEWKARLDAGCLEVEISPLELGAGRLEVRVLALTQGRLTRVTINGSPTPLKKERILVAGTRISVMAAEN